MRSISDVRSSIMSLHSVNKRATFFSSQSFSHFFFLGFGSFVEKTVMPYISTTPAKLRNPCTGDQNCTSPFSYKNVLSLTSEGNKFNELVGKQHISGNLDSPEGGFDAIMQVAVCGVSMYWFS